MNKEKLGQRSALALSEGFAGARSESKDTTDEIGCRRFARAAWVGNDSVLSGNPSGGFLQSRH